MPLQKAALIKKTYLAEGTIQLDFETEASFEFQAGQFISIKVEDNSSSPCIRGYSIASYPHSDNQNKAFSLCVKLVENGRGSNWLNSLKEGQEIQFLGPNGKFLFNPNPDSKNILFIATGTGIAPLKTMIEDQLLNKNNQNKFHLLFGVRYIKEIFYQDVFQKLADKFSNFTYEITISRPEKEDWSGNKGRVTALLENLKIDTTNTEAYLCGLKYMLTEVTSILESKGLSPDKVHSEQYY